MCYGLLTVSTKTSADLPADKLLDFSQYVYFSPSRYRGSRLADNLAVDLNLSLDDPGMHDISSDQRPLLNANLIEPSPGAAWTLQDHNPEVAARYIPEC